MIEEFYINEAIKEAQKAFEKGEVPVGAVIVVQNRIIAKAHNQVELLKDATAHAEILAITQASNTIDNWRLNNAVLYVTKEPCPMCAGALVHSRIKKVIFGAYDDQMGACGTVMNIANDARLRHQLQIVGGIKEAECRELLQEFFKKQRVREKITEN